MGLADLHPASSTSRPRAQREVVGGIGSRYERRGQCFPFIVRIARVMEYHRPMRMMVLGFAAVLVAACSGSGNGGGGSGGLGSLVGSGGSGGTGRLGGVRRVA